MRIPILCTALAIGAVVSLNAAITPTSQASLAGALAFHAPFDGGVDARHAAGDPKLYWSPTFARRAEAQPGTAADRHRPRAGRRAIR